MINLSSAHLSRKDFNRIATFVYDYSGINLAKTKRSMVEGRLRKRLVHNKMVRYKQYCDFVLSAQGKKEVLYLIDVLTTNKTDFFREIKHFDYLTKTLLPALTKNGVGRKRPLRIWSAGCSSGEECTGQVPQSGRDLGIQFY